MIKEREKITPHFIFWVRSHSSPVCVVNGFVQPLTSFHYSRTSVTTWHVMSVTSCFELRYKQPPTNGVGSWQTNMSPSWSLWERNNCENPCLFPQEKWPLAMLNSRAFLCGFLSLPGSIVLGLKNEFSSHCLCFRSLNPGKGQTLIPETTIFNINTNLPVAGTELNLQKKLICSPLNSMF